MSEHARAVSEYRQIRLTLTQERSGLVTWRLHGKHYQDDWDERALLLHGQMVHHEEIESTEDAISLLLGVLQSSLLP